MIGSQAIGHRRIAADEQRHRSSSARRWVARAIEWIRDLAASCSSGSSQLGPEPEQVLGRATGART